MKNQIIYPASTEGKELGLNYLIVFLCIFITGGKVYANICDPGGLWGCTLVECTARSAAKNFSCKKGPQAAEKIGGCTAQAGPKKRTPAQCAVRFPVWESCAVARQYYQNCFKPGSNANKTHLVEAAKAHGQFIACSACALGIGPEDYMKIFGKNGSSKLIKKFWKKLGKKAACKLALKSAAKLLGPIGVAFTLGEIGAYLIVTAGDAHASGIEKSFACSNKSSTEGRKTSWGNQFWALHSKFTSDYCPIYYEVEMSPGGCGPVGFKKFNPTPACNSLSLTPLEKIKMVQDFEKLGETGLTWLSYYRTHVLYERKCSGLPNC
jgi:hypothetical protein